MIHGCFTKTGFLKARDGPVFVVDTQVIDDAQLFFVAFVCAVQFVYNKESTVRFQDMEASRKLVAGTGQKYTVLEAAVSKGSTMSQDRTSSADSGCLGRPASPSFPCP